MSWVTLALLSAGFAALVAIFGKMGLQGIDTTLATTLRAVIMAVFLVGVSLALGKFEAVPDFGKKAGLMIVLSGLAGALSWLFYFSALKAGPASAVAAIDRLSVVFVFILALIFLGETFTWKSALGALFVALGAILMTIK
ncbi:MAG: EamA family transporter [Patescibacteria group bacterium]|nr:EamA family transporter [bacterium]MDZ4240865.1 EamA family transporter [Patescibacteria group bacterium]